MKAKMMFVGLVFSLEVMLMGDFRVECNYASAEEIVEAESNIETEFQTLAAAEMQESESQTQAFTDSAQTETQQVEETGNTAVEKQSENATEAETEQQMQEPAEALPAETVEPETSAEIQTEVPYESETYQETIAEPETCQLSETAEVETETQTSEMSNDDVFGETENMAETENETKTEIYTENQKDEETETEEYLKTGQTEFEEETDLAGTISSDDYNMQEEKELEGKASSGYSTNAELLAAQHIVDVNVSSLEYRFIQIEKVYATTILESGVKIYESKSTEATIIGGLRYHSVCYIIEDKDDGWYYVESGKVRGFARTEELIIGEEALQYVSDDSRTAFEIVPYYENAAFTYTHTTAQDVIADKVYALAGSDTNIYESKNTESSVIGTLSTCGLCYILVEDDEWVFVESGQARGFVQKDSLVMGAVAKNKVDATGESDFTLADVIIEPADNNACYYTLTSVDAADQSSYLREQIVEYALQFVGNPYVWGGTSLTNGADCSGFVQSVYAHFGYSLPRTAAPQSVCGTQIPVSQAEPGDLIFYAEDGYVYHVSMYIGNGQVVHAANSRVGIITSGIWSDAVWAVRIIE